MLEDLRRRLAAANITEAARSTGLSRTIVDDIKHGRATNPTIRTVKLLTDYLNQKEKQNGNASQG